MATQTLKTKGHKPPKAKAYRFDARLNEEQKVLIQKAADIEGRSMTDFVLHSAEAAAERTIEERAMLILSVRETEAFVHAILHPAEPGLVFRAAARQYKRTIGQRPVATRLRILSSHFLTMIEPRSPAAFPNWTITFTVRRVKMQSGRWRLPS